MEVFEREWEGGYGRWGDHSQGRKVFRKIVELDGFFVELWTDGGVGIKVVLWGVWRGSVYGVGVGWLSKEWERDEVEKTFGFTLLSDEACWDYYYIKGRVNWNGNWVLENVRKPRIAKSIILLIVIKAKIKGIGRVQINF